MLSPTLPPIFAKNIALPVPKRVSAVIETNNQFLGNNFNGKVKTIRKNVDTTSEKYIVQLSFSPEYRQKYGNLIKSKPPISEPVALPPLSHTSVSASITSSAPHFSLRAPTSPTTRPLAGLGISVKESTLEAGLQEYRSKLIQRKNHWIQLAKETSQKSSGTSNSKLSIVIRFDSIVLYMIAYDFEEKIKLVSDMLPLERYWSLLLKECKELIEVLKLEPLSELRDAFIGVLHSIRGVLLKRVNTILQKVINLYLQKKKETESYGENLSSKIIELQQQYISNCEQVVTEFQSNAKYDFSAILSQNFPKTFENRLRKMSTLPNKPKPDITGFVPSTDKYYLPIGVYSDLQEIAGLTYTCLKEYLEITKITYQLKCVG